MLSVGCVLIDKTDPVVTFVGFTGVGVVDVGSTLLYADENGSFPDVTVSFTAVEDLSPLVRVVSCWSSNAFGTCDVTPRATQQLAGNATTQQVTFSMAMKDPAVRGALDGKQVSAHVCFVTVPPFSQLVRVRVIVSYRL